MPSSSTSRPSEGPWWRGALLAALLASPLAAQYDEDAREPRDLGIRDLETIAVPRTGYVGNDSCAVCHPSAYERWLGAKHSRTAVALYSMMAMTIAQKELATAAMPTLSGLCLQCHGTAHDVPAAYRGPGVRMAEGVTCEKCHGPGQEHGALARAQKARGVWDLAALKATLDEPRPCLTCHREKKSHEALHRPPFDEVAGRPRVAHPSPPSEKVH